MTSLNPLACLTEEELNDALDAAISSSDSRLLISLLKEFEKRDGIIEI